MLSGVMTLATLRRQLVVVEPVVAEPSSLVPLLLLES